MSKRKLKKLKSNHQVKKRRPKSKPQGQGKSVFMSLDRRRDLERDVRFFDMKISDFNNNLSTLNPIDIERKAYIFTDFANSCGIFLRKAVIDHRNRFFSPKYNKENNIKFSPLKKIGNTITNSIILKTQLRNIFGFSVKQNIKASYDFPLYGLHESSNEQFILSSSSLFDKNAKTLNLDGWLCQNVLVIDGRQVNLLQIIKSVASFDAAHRVQLEEEHAIQKHLKSIHVVDIPYDQLITIQSALYIYEIYMHEVLKRESNIDITFALELTKGIFKEHRDILIYKPNGIRIITPNSAFDEANKDKEEVVCDVKIKNA